MARTKLGNTAVSSLLKTAQASYNRTQAYNDQMAGYEYDLSEKTPEDFAKYKAYLSDRATKEQDPSKQLSLQKTLTSADRTYRSAEIFRASESVNYGDISNTDKYQKMLGLYQDAVSNGDYNQAQSIEGQLASLSITIQNQRDAAASAAAAGSGRGRGGSGSGGSPTAAYTTQLNDLENKIDRAYQTGQPLIVDGQAQMLNSSQYAMNRASILKAKHDLLSQQAATDPKYADDLSKLEQSPEYRGLIDSGAVQFDDQGNPQATDQIKNLAVSFKTDKYGNTYRDFTAIPADEQGKQQYGLRQVPDGSGNKDMFVANRELNNTITDPNLKARVAYDVHDFKQNGKDASLNGNKVGVYNDLISGNKVLADRGTGLRATAFNGSKEQRTPDQALGDLTSLVNPQTAGNPGIGDVVGLHPANIKATYAPVVAGAEHGLQEAGHVVNALAGGAETAVGDVKGEVSKLLKPSHTAYGIGDAVNGALGKLQGLASIGNMQKAIAAAKAAAAAQAAEQARQVQLAYQRQQAVATTSASRAATPAPRIYTPVPAYNPSKPVTSTNQLYLPAPKLAPAQTFSAALAAGKSTQAAIGNAVGYRF